MRRFRLELQLHLLLIPGILVTLVYAYGPMAGSVMAFQKFEPGLGFFKSEWVGWQNFAYIFHMPDFQQVLWNTVLIASLKILLSLFLPLVLALMLNELTRVWFRRLLQTSYYFPFFLSWTVLGGVFMELFSLRGPVNGIFAAIGLEPILFFGDNNWFRAILIGSDVWKNMGYNMIIYLAAMTAINSSLYEAAEVDGAGKWSQMRHITLPGMKGIIILLGTLALGNILNAGFDQILIMYNPTVYHGSDVLDTFVYRLGLFSQQFGPATAVGLFKSGISVVLVSVSYYAAYKFNNYRIF